VNDSRQKALKADKQQINKWKERFSFIMNCPLPSVLHDFS